jgi:hypothetical protein
LVRQQREIRPSVDLPVLPKGGCRFYGVHQAL